MPRLQIPNPRNVQGLVSAGGLGVLSACNAPLRGHTVTVQRNAAEVRGVPENPFFGPEGGCRRKGAP